MGEVAVVMRNVSELVAESLGYMRRGGEGALSKSDGLVGGL